MSRVNSDPTLEIIPFKRIKMVRPDVEALAFALTSPLPSLEMVKVIDGFRTRAVGNTPLPMAIHVERDGHSFHVIGGFRAWQWARVLTREGEHPLLVPAMVWPRMPTEIVRSFALADGLVQVACRAAEDQSSPAWAQGIFRAIAMVPGFPSAKNELAKLLGVTIRSVQRYVATPATEGVKPPQKLKPQSQPQPHIDDAPSPPADPNVSSAPEAIRSATACDSMAMAAPTGTAPSTPTSSHSANTATTAAVAMPAAPPAQPRAATPGRTRVCRPAEPQSLSLFEFLP